MTAVTTSPTLTLHAATFALSCLLAAPAAAADQRLAHHDPANGWHIESLTISGSGMDARKKGPRGTAWGDEDNPRNRLTDSHVESITIEVPNVLIREYADGSCEAMHADIYVAGPSHPACINRLRHKLLDKARTLPVGTVTFRNGQAHLLYPLRTDRPDPPAD